MEIRSTTHEEGVWLMRGCLIVEEKEGHVFCGFETQHWELLRWKCRNKGRKSVLYVGVLCVRGNINDDLLALGCGGLKFCEDVPCCFRPPLFHDQ